MKYSKYLISGKFIDTNALHTNKFYLKLPMTIIAILIAVLGIATIFGMLPMTVVVDEYRNIKCRLIHFKRNEYKL